MLGEIEMAMRLSAGAGKALESTGVSSGGIGRSLKGLGVSMSMRKAVVVLYGLWGGRRTSKRARRASEEVGRGLNNEGSWALTRKVLEHK